MKYPKLLQVGPGRKFVDALTLLMEKHSVEIRGRTEIHRDQGVVERVNRTLVERLFGYQYAEESQNPHICIREWVKRLPRVIKAINWQAKKAHPIVTRKVDTPICPFANVRYVYQPGELEDRQQIQYGLLMYTKLFFLI